MSLRWIGRKGKCATGAQLGMCSLNFAMDTRFEAARGGLRLGSQLHVGQGGGVGREGREGGGVGACGPGSGDGSNGLEISGSAMRLHPCLTSRTIVRQRRDILCKSAEGKIGSLRA